MTIAGTNLASATAVDFGGVLATITNDTANQITATSPAESAATVDVTVVTAEGSSAKTVSDQFTYAATPTLTGISPATGSSNGGTIVTITGTNLTNLTAVEFGSTVAAILSDTANQIVAMNPAESGTVDVTAVTLGGTTATSPNDQFTYLAMPVVTGVGPKTGPATGGTSVIIMGMNLANATAVKFGNTPAAITSDSANQIIATSPAGSGTLYVTVVTMGGTSPILTSDQFSYYVPPPAVTGFSPTVGLTTGGTVVTITGSSLANATAVKFGSVPATILSASANQITVASPAGSGTANVTVATVAGTAAAPSNEQFSYMAAPTVTGISPNSGPTAGGEQVTLTGSNLANVTAVNFGNSLATNVVINAAGTQLTATSPAESAGTVYVTVIVASGSSSASSADLFRYYVPAPVVTGLSSKSGPTAGGTAVTISGTGLAGASAVDFGGAAAGNVVVNAAGTQITATSPAASAGMVDVTVVTAGGTSATSSNDQFSYMAPPTVTGLSPTSGITAGGTQVTITGTNLAGASAVQFGGAAASNVVVNAAGTQLTASSPAGSAGMVYVTVVTAAGPRPRRPTTSSATTCRRQP